MQRRVTSGLKDSVKILKEINLPVGENSLSLEVMEKVNSGVR